ncbi:MAG: Transglutaminase-like superfamily protein [Phycisphaerales bacterium]|nr:Transglutaminase-like superfamily protein [Phycisphaerales bacterium]
MLALAMKHPTRLLLSCPVVGCLLVFGFCAAPLPAADAPADVNSAVSLVPAGYRHRLVQQLSLAEANQQQWLDAIAHAKPEHREAVAFLLVNMPEPDLKALKGDFILHNVELAYEARAKSLWASAVPQELFFNEVLPYANLNERRDDWRADFMQRFMPLVKDCKTSGEAAQVLNREVFKAVKVAYHASKRKKPDQSPYESMEIHYASCSGLSIILADACRAVGVPARVAGTPLWQDNSGNHTWVEVWDGQWKFVGAAEPGEFNQTWFGEVASKANPAQAEHRIYAASYEKTSQPFVMVWDERNADYGAVDVTRFYVHRRKLEVKATDAADKPATATIQVRKDGKLIAQAAGTSATFELAADEKYEVAALNASGEKVIAGVKLGADADVSQALKLPAVR